jgi:hypothetical protein
VIVEVHRQKGDITGNTSRDYLEEFFVD